MIHSVACVYHSQSWPQVAILQILQNVKFNRVEQAELIVTVKPPRIGSSRLLPNTTSKSFLHSVITVRVVSSDRILFDDHGFSSYMLLTFYRECDDLRLAFSMKTGSFCRNRAVLL